MIQEIFKDEFLLISDGQCTLEEEKVKQILKEAHEHKLVNIDFGKGHVKILDNPISKDMLAFLRGLLQSFIDTYLVVALAIDNMQNTGKTVR